jgi:hypothetical protein
MKAACDAGTFQGLRGSVLQQQVWMSPNIPDPEVETLYLLSEVHETGHLIL